MLAAMVGMFTVMVGTVVLDPSGDATPRGIFPVLGLVWLATVWLSAVGWRFNQWIVVASVAAGGILPVLMVNIENTPVRVAAAAAEAVATAFAYRLLMLLDMKLQLSAGFTVIGLAAAAVLTLSVPSAIGEATGPVWTRVGLAVGLIALVVVVVIDGLGKERGRLRTPGFLLLGVCAVLGLLGLFL